MGQNSRIRHAAKVKARQQRARAGHTKDPRAGHAKAPSTDQTHTHDRPRVSNGPDATQVDSAIAACLVSFANPLARHLASAHWQTLTDQSPRVRLLVQQRLWHALRVAVGACWARGWLPLEVDRSVVRHPVLGKSSGSLPQQIVRDLIADDVAAFASATVDQRISAQVNEIDASVWWPADQLPLMARAAAETASWETILSSTFLVLRHLRNLRPLPRVCPPPGQAAVTRPSRAPVVEDRILERVRRLLAKAESTTFEAEAETFTAGAQALMARHSIDAAMLAASAPDNSDGPAHIRLYLYPPYEEAKSHLLHSIARANRCKAVWLSDIGCASVIGFSSDLLAVEALFTSLLVQSTSAMQRLGSRQDRDGRSRTRSFRSSFLISFATRIGERLARVTAEETTKATVNAEVHGRNVLPVLAARDQQVADEFNRVFPRVEHRGSRRTYDAEGWHAGREAADSAELRYSGQVPR